MDYEVIMYLYGAISLITLICFFVLVANVSTIKKKLNSRGLTYYKDKYEMYLSFEDKDKAKEMLKLVVWEDYSSLSKRSSNSDSFIYSKLHDKYGNDFSRHGMNFPKILLKGILK